MSRMLVDKRLPTLWNSFQVGPKLLSLELYVEECPEQEDNAQVTTPISVDMECRTKEVLPQDAQVRERTSASISEGVVCNCFRGENSQALSKPLPARLLEGDKGITRMKGSRFVYEMTSESPNGGICKKKLLVPDLKREAPDCYGPGVLFKLKRPRIAQLCPRIVPSSPPKENAHTPLTQLALRSHSCLD